jgi:hypothetical protein
MRIARLDIADVLRAESAIRWLGFSFTRHTRASVPPSGLAGETSGAVRRHCGVTEDLSAFAAEVVPWEHEPPLRKPGG